MGELYRLDFPSGKSYIGISRHSAAKRIKQHRQSSQTSELLLYRAWRMHGEPTLTVLAVLEESALLEAEISAIATYGTLAPDGYNSTTGGDISPALMDAVKKKIGDRHRGRVLSEEWKAKISAGGKGVARSDETRARMSQAMLKRMKCDDARSRASLHGSSPKNLERLRLMAEARKGIPLSEDRAEKCRAALKQALQAPRGDHPRPMLGKRHSEETKAKMSAAAKGKPKSAEHRERLSESRKGMRPSDETRAKLSASHTGKKHTPETLQKMREAWAKRKAAKLEGIDREHHALSNFG